jgi:hypothetical protein
MADLTQEQLDELFANMDAVEAGGGDLSAGPTEEELAESKRIFSRKNMGRGIADAMKGGIPFLNNLQGMIDAEDAGEPVSGAAGAAGSFERSSTFGLNTVANAGINQLGDLLSGDDRSTFRDDFKKGNEVISENGSLWAELAGAISPGGIASTGVKGAEKGIAALSPKLGEYLTKRGLFPSLARGTAQTGIATVEGGLYSLGTGGDLDDITSAAITSGAFGGTMQLGADILGPVLKSLATGIGNRRPDTQAANLLIKRFQSLPDTAKFLKTENGEQVFDVDAMKAAMENSDASIVEMFPQAVVEDLKAHLANPNANVQVALRPLRDFVAARREAADPKFQEALSKAIGSPDVRTQEAMTMAARQTRQELQPQYDAALSIDNLNPDFVMNGAAVNVSQKAIKKLIKESFTGMENSAKAMDVRDQLLGRVIGKAYDPRQLLTLRTEIDDALFKGSIGRTANFSELSSIDKAVRMDALIPLREQFNVALHNIAPGLKELDATYSGEAAYSSAYEAGNSMFRSNRTSTDAFDLYQSTPGRTPAQMAAFVEGSKSALLETLDGKSPAQIDKYFSGPTDRLAKLSNILGTGGMDQLRQAAQQLSAQSQLVKALTKNIPAQGAPSGAMAKAVDMLSLAAAPTGALGTTFLAGALKRQGGEAAGVSGGRGLTSAIADSALNTMPADASAAKINEMLMADMPGLAKFLPGMAAVGGSQQNQ